MLRMQEMAFPCFKFKTFSGGVCHTHMAFGHCYPRLISNDKLWIIFFFTFCAFFPSLISNTSIGSINFRANLDAHNAVNCSSGLQISKIFCGSMPPDPPRDSCVVCRPHGFPPLIYYLTEKSLFKKCLPPDGKILRKGPDIISNFVIYVYCVSKAVGQTNNAPPPPPTRLGVEAQDAVEIRNQPYRSVVKTLIKLKRK
jgi:hypothetical protein